MPSKSKAPRTMQRRLFSKGTELSDIKLILESEINFVTLDEVDDYFNFTNKKSLKDTVTVIVTLRSENPVLMLVLPASKKKTLYGWKLEETKIEKKLPDGKLLYALLPVH